MTTRRAAALSPTLLLLHADQCNEDCELRKLLSESCDESGSLTNKGLLMSIKDEFFDRLKKMQQEMLESLTWCAPPERPWRKVSCPIFCRRYIPFSPHFRGGLTFRLLRIHCHLPSTVLSTQRSL